MSELTCYDVSDFMLSLCLLHKLMETLLSLKQTYKGWLCFDLSVLIWNLPIKLAKMNKI